MGSHWCKRCEAMMRRSITSTFRCWPAAEFDELVGCMVPHIEHKQKTQGSCGFSCRVQPVARVPNTVGRHSKIHIHAYSETVLVRGSTMEHF